MREVVKRWCNGKLIEPTAEFYACLKSAVDENSREANPKMRWKVKQESLKAIDSPQHLIFNENDEAIRIGLIEPMVESMIDEVRLERLKLFYLKWVYDNGDEPKAEFAKLKVPFKQWLNKDSLKKHEQEWDKKKSEDVNRGECLWKLLKET